jgi:hypothetical protein
MVSKLNRGKGVVLDYMGHADVTLALIDIDPLYDYGWNVNDAGDMLIREVDGRLVLEGWLSLHGVWRRGVGTCAARQPEPEKELIGDLLRNCAMRFGVATSLWSKAERHDAAQAADPAPRASEPVNWRAFGYTGPDEFHERHDAFIHAAAMLPEGDDRDALRARYREVRDAAKGNPIHVDDLTLLEERLAALLEVPAGDCASSPADEWTVDPPVPLDDPGEVAA